jgi:hypothetical protein
VSICVIAACFHQVEATFPPNGSNLSRLWKQGFHPLEEQTVEKVKDEGIVSEYKKKKGRP